MAEVAAAVPAEVHRNLIVIGSLAAAYWLFHGNESMGVRTKDIDCVLSPQISAVENSDFASGCGLRSGAGTSIFSRPPSRVVMVWHS